MKFECSETPSDAFKVKVEAEVEAFRRNPILKRDELCSHFSDNLVLLILKIGGGSGGDLAVAKVDDYVENNCKALFGLFTTETDWAKLSRLSTSGKLIYSSTQNADHASGIFWEGKKKSGPIYNINPNYGVPVRTMDSTYLVFVKAAGFER